MVGIDDIVRWPGAGECIVVQSVGTRETHLPRVGLSAKSAEENWVDTLASCFLGLFRLFAQLFASPLADPRVQLPLDWILELARVSAFFLPCELLFMACDLPIYQLHRSLEEGS